MSVDPFADHLVRLDEALSRNDLDAVSSLLDGVPSGAEGRVGHAMQWSRLATILTELLQRDCARFARSVQHQIDLLLWLEQHQRPEDACSRLEQLLPAFDRLVEANQLKLLEIIDSIRHWTEPCANVGAWLDRIRAGSIHAHVTPDVAAAAMLAYDCGLHRNRTKREAGWSSAWPRLWSALTAAGTNERAYAALLLGEWHLEYDRLRPTLRETLDRVTVLDLARPGVAGPFFGPFYADQSVEAFSARAAVDAHAWMMDILERRRGSEPITIPCSNGIDFYAHEMFVDPADLVRLIRAGHIAIAQESASDSGLDFRQLLRTFSNEPQAVARDVAATLLVEYGEIPTDQNTRSVIRFLEAIAGVQRIGVDPADRAPEEPSVLVLLPTVQDEMLSDETILSALAATITSPALGSETSRRQTSWLGGGTTIIFPNRTVLHLIGPGGERGRRRAVLEYHISPLIGSLREAT